MNTYQINAKKLVGKYMNWLTSVPKQRIRMDSFFKVQFTCCPLIWMCHSHENNRKINHLHERHLKVLYNDRQSSFNELPMKNVFFDHLAVSRPTLRHSRADSLISPMLMTAFVQFLPEGNRESVSSHERNIQILATEM